MTINDANEIYYICREIDLIEDELRRLDADRTYYRPILLSDMPKSPNTENKNPSDNYLEKKMKLETMLRYAVNRLHEKRIAFEQFLETVSDPEMRLIMRMRCIECESWETIGDTIGYNRTTVSRKFKAFFTK